MKYNKLILFVLVLGFTSVWLVPNAWAERGPRHRGERLIQILDLTPEQIELFREMQANLEPGERPDFSKLNLTEAQKEQLKQFRMRKRGRWGKGRRTNLQVSSGTRP